MLMLSAPEGAYANAALFIALVRKLIDKGVISKEEMSTIVDEAGASLSQGNSVAMRQALQSLWRHRDRKPDNGRLGDESCSGEEEALLSEPFCFWRE